MFLIHVEDVALHQPFRKGYIGSRNSFQVISDPGDPRARRFATREDAAAYVAEHTGAHHYFSSRFTRITIVEAVPAAGAESLCVAGCKGGFDHGK